MRKLLPLLVACFSTAFPALSQTCPSGYASAGLNWDALDYFPTGGYTGYALSGTLSPNQSFAFGKNRLTVTYTGCTTAGEKATHTAETGSYGTGEDVEFAGNGTITLTFASEVANLKFSLYDIDMAQKLRLGATNAAGVQQAIMVTYPSTTSKLTLNGTTTSPLVEDNNTTGTGGNMKPGTDVDISSSDASINVDIAGPVKTITLTTTNLANIGTGQTIKYDSYFLSDISACTNSGSFPLNYYEVSKPFKGMPAYVLVAVNDHVYQVDPATGKAKKIFRDGANSGTINSLAYDPYNKVAYFCWSLTNNGSTTASARVLRKYDFTTGEVTAIANDVSAEMSLPTFNQGTESGAAAFYDGALYLGIEGGEDDGNGGNRKNVSRESIIWRLDFPAGGGYPIITQAYGVDGDRHDWSDFAIKDGMLYDFNGDATYPDYHHFNLQTASNLLVTRSTNPKQCAVGWDGTLHWVDNTIATYNYNGGVVAGTSRAITSTPAIPNWTGSSVPSFGDAAEAFRPAVDFGDAPIAYDPDPDAPALHEKVDNLRLGGTTDVEWTKPVPGLNADADGVDEDAIPYAPAMMNNGTYQVTVSVLNNTTGNATLIGWLDIDGDNIFEPTEAISAVVLPQSSTQTVSLYWPSTVTSLPNNSYTYLRLRLTSAANNMTTSDPSGYFADGEVEDWRVMVNVTPLAVKLADFGVRKTEQGQVDIRWTVTGEEAHTRYELQKSADGQHWTGIYQVRAAANRATAAYQYVDAAPYQGKNYYRLKITEANEGVQYSAISKVVFDRTLDVHFAPNPAAGSVRLTVQSEEASRASIRLLDMSSRTVYEKAFTVASGMNQLTVPLEGLAPGVYQAEVLVGNRRYTQKLVVRK